MEAISETGSASLYPLHRYSLICLRQISVYEANKCISVGPALLSDASLYPLHR